MLNLIRLLVATLALAGCSLLGSGPASVAGRTFLSTDVVVDSAPTLLVNGTRIRLTFNANGEIGAQAGCNSLGGTYRLDGNILHVDGGFMTEMGCEPDRSAQDDWLFGFLAARPTLTLNANQLVLQSGGTVVTLLDREIAQPDLRLVGPTWTVTSIIDGDVAIGIADVVATLEFTADGHVGVSTGCNSGGGRYTVDGATIVFDQVVMTEVACSGAAGQMDAAVLAVIGSDAAPFSIDASTLSLRVGERGLDLIGG